MTSFTGTLRRLHVAALLIGCVAMLAKPAPMADVIEQAPSSEMPARSVTAQRCAGREFCSVNRPVSEPPQHIVLSRPTRRLD
jgi:hypothetical protein